MEILGGSLDITLAPNTSYDITMIDQDTLKTSTSAGTSNGAGTLTVVLPIDYTKYDGWFSLEIANNGNVVYFDTVTSTRPYADPSRIVDYVLPKVITVEQATEYERIARTLINAILGFEFSYKRKNLHLVGNGTDFLPTGERVLKVYSVKENNQVIWSDGDQYAFEPFVGQYAVVRDAGDEPDNRLESRMTWSTRYAAPEFIENYDYVLDADCGWPVVPQDIQDVTMMIAADIACGNNRYSNKYIKSTGSGQQSIDYFYRVTAGTGNVIADKILSKYAAEAIRVQVL